MPFQDSFQWGSLLGIVARTACARPAGQRLAAVVRLSGCRFADAGPRDGNAATGCFRLIWRAISSITPMMSEILREESSTCQALPADELACRAFSEFFFTVEEGSCIEAEVCSRLAACSSVRCDRSVEILVNALDISRSDCVDTDRAL